VLFKKLPPETDQRRLFLGESIERGVEIDASRAQSTTGGPQDSIQFRYEKGQF
jgi:hypothetical protein